jgi:LysM repeat protein
MAFMGSSDHETSVALEEMRIELADLKHSGVNTKMEFQLLEEKLQNQEHALSALKSNSLARPQPKFENLSLQLSAIEKKIALLEKTQEKITSDLRQISTQTNQAANSLAQYRDKIQEVEQAIVSHSKRLDEVTKLKSTLTAISQTMKEPPIAEGSSKKYKIKAGDSLEKIARSQHTSVEAIKKLNHLTSDRIVVGGELKIPNDEE